MVWKNDVLESLSGQEQLRSVDGDVLIHDNAVLVGLNGTVLEAVGGDLTISSNPALTSIAALSSLSSVGVSVTLQNNPTLSSLDGMEGVTDIPGSLTMDRCDALTSVDPLRGVVRVGGSLIWLYVVGDMFYPL